MYIPFKIKKWHVVRDRGVDYNELLLLLKTHVKKQTIELTVDQAWQIFNSLSTLKKAVAGRYSNQELQIIIEKKKKKISTYEIKKVTNFLQSDYESINALKSDYATLLFKSKKNQE
jgi:hypothetical protein